MCEGIKMLFLPHGVSQFENKRYPSDACSQMSSPRPWLLIQLVIIEEAGHVSQPWTNTLAEIFVALYCFPC
jgi:hypothetical protein